MGVTEARNPVVVITGASAGMGRATARAFARKGTLVGLLARDPARFETACREVNELGGRGLAIPTDVAFPDQVKAAARVEEALGPTDIWANNATVSVFAPVAQIEPAEFARVSEVTYLGVVCGTMAALRRMAPRNHGTIVQVGSALSYRAIPLQAPYCGAKHAIRAFTDSLRVELRHDHVSIHLTMVKLPTLNTPQFTWNLSRLPREPQPVPPIFQPEVAAGAILWAAENSRRELYVGWSVAATILAARFFPGLIDAYLARTGYASQQTGKPVQPDRPNNLASPVPGSVGARVPFGGRAKDRSMHLWATTHFPWPALVDGLTGALGGVRLLLNLCGSRSRREASGT